MAEQENVKTFYERAEELYNLVKAESDLFKQRPPLKNCVEYLLKAYNRGEIDTIEGLPKDISTISHFDPSETSGLIEILNDFFIIAGVVPLNFDSQEQAEKFCIPGKYLFAYFDTFEKIASYFFTQAVKKDIPYTN